MISLPGAITKNGKPRQIPLISELKTTLQNYLKKMKIEHRYLSPSEEDRERPCRVERVYDRCYALLKRLASQCKRPHHRGYKDWRRSSNSVDGSTGSGHTRLRLKDILEHRSHTRLHGLPHVSSRPPLYLISTQAEDDLKILMEERVEIYRF